jgi:FHS family L-fucose permease-like MFS transporter
MCSSCELPSAAPALGYILIVVTPFSFCDLPEITEEALTRELVATGGEAAADVGPFYKQYRCIFGFVAQTCYVCVS